MNDIVEWMAGMNLPIHKVMARLPDIYSEAEVLYAIKEVHDKNRYTIKPIHVFWKIREILKHNPDDERKQGITDLFTALGEVDKLLVRIAELEVSVDRRSAALRALMRSNKEHALGILFWKREAWEWQWLARPWYLKIFDGPSEMEIW